MPLLSIKNLCEYSVFSNSNLTVGRELLIIFDYMLKALADEDIREIMEKLFSDISFAFQHL